MPSICYLETQVKRTAVPVLQPALSNVFRFTELSPLRVLEKKVIVQNKEK